MRKTKTKTLFLAVLALAAAFLASGIALAADDTSIPMGGMMGGYCAKCPSYMKWGMAGGMRSGMGAWGTLRWAPHGEVERGMMMGGLSGMEISPVLKMEFMKAMMRSMIRNALQDPEIKAFLDSTASLRKNLVMKEFEYFEAFRNPKTTPAELSKLKSDIMGLKIKIREKMPTLKNWATK